MGPASVEWIWVVYGMRIKPGPKRTLLVMSHTVLSGIYFSQLSDFLNNFKFRFSSSFSFFHSKAKTIFVENEQKIQLEPKHEGRYNSFPQLHKETLQMPTVIFIFWQLKHCVWSKKPQCHSHPHNKKPAWEECYIYHVCRAGNKEIFSVLDPRTEVQNKAYARSIHQLCCEAFYMHSSILFNWNYWQHFE